MTKISKPIKKELTIARKRKIESAKMRINPKTGHFMHIKMVDHLRKMQRLNLEIELEDGEKMEGLRVEIRTLESEFRFKNNQTVVNKKGSAMFNDLRFLDGSGRNTKMDLIVLVHKEDGKTQEIIIPKAIKITADGHRDRSN